ncbi:hypothetical protein [Psychrobacter sp. AOP3-A1-26]|uniref:hypothetical protein n=1 Tax=Psychrobacter sp. AOP3-A1-26 TaxID=3457700 RepID=UPI00403650E3
MRSLFILQKPGVSYFKFRWHHRSPWHYYFIRLFATLLAVFTTGLYDRPCQKIRAFWLAAVLVFFAVIRRELNYVPDLFISSGFSFLNHSYDWWEDAILTVVYLLIVGLLAYSWRYLWAVLRSVPIAVYASIIALAILEYMGENYIIIPESIGEIVEELAETGVYAIALVYLWQFKLIDFEEYLSHKSSSPCKA